MNTGREERLHRPLSLWISSGTRIAGTSRATAGPGKTFLRGPFGEKNFCFVF